MEENKTQRTMIKIIVLLAGLILLVLLMIGIIQTLIHNNLISKNEQLNAYNEQVEMDNEQVEEELEIRNSDEYLDDYLKQEKEYGNDGDIIIKD